MWINLDFRKQRVTNHEDDCKFIGTNDTRQKKTNGGWKKFENVEQATSYIEDKYPDLKRGNCPNCNKKGKTTTRKSEAEIHPPINEEEIREHKLVSGIGSRVDVALEYGFDDEDEDEEK